MAEKSHFGAFASSAGLRHPVMRSGINIRLHLYSQTGMRCQTELFKLANSSRLWG
jgi:hypothetical protein